jgi:hypothetical protein
MAKPIPPSKFKNRQTESAMKHSFSHHDNRQAFLNDPLLFTSGLGKKKVASVNRSKWNPEFIAWSQDTGRDRFRSTLYQRDFCIVPDNDRLLSTRKRLDQRDVSVYKYTYEHGEPTRDHSIETQRDTYYRFLEKNINQRRPKTAGVPAERVTVASCLVWNTGGNSAAARVGSSVSLAANPVVVAENN